MFAPASVRHSLSKLNSAFDFIDFAIARHSSNKFDSALAYSQNYSLILIKLRKSLTRRFIRKLIKLRKSPFCFLLYRLSVLISSSVFVIIFVFVLQFRPRLRLRHRFRHRFRYRPNKGERLTVSTITYKPNQTYVQPLSEDYGRVQEW